MLNYLKKAFYVLQDSKGELFLLLVIFTFSSILEVIGVGLILPFLRIASNPSIIQESNILSAINDIFGFNEPTSLVPLIGFAIILIVCIKSYLYFSINARIISFSYQQKKKLVTKLVSAYLRVPYTFHLDRNSASIIKNVGYETDLFASSCLVPLLQTFSNLIIFVALLGLLARVNSLLLAIIAILMLPLMFFLVRVSRAHQKFGQITSQSRQDIIKTLNHGLGGIKETKVIGCESHFEQEINHHSQKLAESVAKSQSLMLLPRTVIEAVLIISVVLIVILSQLLFRSSYQDLIPSLSVFAIASIRLLPSASLFLQAISKMRQGSYALSMLYNDLKELEIYESFPIHPDLALGDTAKSGSREANRRKFPFEKSILIENISYRYPHADNLAISNLTLEIRKGQSVAFIGKSGAGKTTLADVILGLLKPQSGDLLIDGESIYRDIKAWQNMIGYIPQSIFLLDDSIESNIAFGVPKDSIDHNLLDSVIKSAQLSDLIEQLPRGVSTSVGERGVRLSGGQRQRIGIARALYHQREILVLDEATSALDNDTEKLISTAINSLAGNKTLIVIAHRLSTIENCDRVFVMESGQLVNSGTYMDVVTSSS